MSNPGIPVNSTSTSLINAAPGVSNTDPGTKPVTSYNPAAATSSPAQTTSYNPGDYTVTPEQTVAGQIKNIIASGSPLMQMAEANAKSAINRRGLINSTEAITAGQKALYESALPIATPDAATFADAARRTTADKNTSLQFGAAAKNTAGLQDAALATDTSKFNAGQTNAAGAQASEAANTAAMNRENIASARTLADIQSAMQKTIAQLQSDTSLTIQQRQDETSKLIADIQSNTTLNAQDKQDATSLAIQASQTTTQRYLADLQSNTTLTSQQRAAEAAAALAAADNVVKTQIAHIQSDTSLTIEQQQAETQKLIASMNNDNAIAVQRMNNAAALDNIKANGEINTKITALTNDNRTLLQTSQGAAQVYSQALQNMAAIMTSNQLDATQKQTALNNSVQMLNDTLSVFSKIAGIPEITSTLVFDTAPSTPAPVYDEPQQDGLTGGRGQGLYDY